MANGILARMGWGRSSQQEQPGFRRNKTFIVSWIEFGWKFESNRDGKCVQLTENLHRVSYLSRLERRNLANVIPSILRHGIAYFQRVAIGQSNAWIWRDFHCSRRNNCDPTLPCDDKVIWKRMWRIKNVRWFMVVNIVFYVMRMKSNWNLKNCLYSPAFATSQGSLIESPATNLNVSDRDIKLGSGLLMCVVTAKEKEEDATINNAEMWSKLHKLFSTAPTCRFH